LLIDPYLSRVPFRTLIRRDPALPDVGLIDRYLGDAGHVVGVLVGHTHFDHAVDAPAICKRFGCPAFGSDSLVRLMQLHGLRELAREVEPYETYELGPFTVSFAPSLHSKLVLGAAVPFDGEITCDHLDGLAPSAYRCGPVWGIHVQVAGATFYHQGSANLVDDAIRTRGVDFFLAGVAGRGFTRDYWQRILTRLQPRTIVPAHYDNFFRPLDAPLGFTTNVNLARVPDEVRAVSRDFEVAALPLLG
jgi:L-ascorbate metabolism protein UlaG (beta-lactamase superfamily)